MWPLNTSARHIRLAKLARLKVSFKRLFKKERSTHHFLLVGWKTPIRLNNHGAQPHILWMSALILRLKEKKRAESGKGRLQSQKRS